MKRNLFESLKAMPYASAGAIDRKGFLSAILAAKVSTITGDPTAAKLTVAVTHCDTVDGSYEAVVDARMFPNGKEFDIDMTADTPALDINIPIDLLACKQYVKITATVTFTGGTTPSSTNAYALVLGDAAEYPVS